MAEGYKLNDEVQNAFNDLKFRRKYKFVQFKITNDKEIVVDHTEEKATFETFVSQLPENECRFAVYSFDYTTAIGMLAYKLSFVGWCPGTASEANKAMHEENKGPIQYKFPGVGIEIHGTTTKELRREIARALPEGHEIQKWEPISP